MSAKQIRILNRDLQGVLEYKGIKGRKLCQERIGFRTIDFRPRDGLYLNGTKLVMKGINIYVVAFIASIIVAVFGRMNLYEALKTDYMASFASFVQNYWLIFLTGALMGKIYEITNGAKSIARVIVKLFGKKYALVVSAFTLYHLRFSRLHLKFSMKQIYRETIFRQRFASDALLLRW